VIFSFQLSAQNDEIISLKGYTLNAEHLEVVQLANISNIRTKERWISNRNGFFKISVHQNDTIKITAIGYQNIFIPIKNILTKNLNDTIIILMTPISYQLKDVDVIRSNSKRDSIARVVAKLLLHDSLMNNYDRIYLRPKGKIYIGIGIIYEGLIQDLYNKFSKAGKDNISFEAFVKYVMMQQKVDEKYNRELVKQLTNINDSEVDEFIIFCNLNRNFIVSAREYDLYEAIKKCGESFKSQQKKR
jgi:hypothetical protein